MIAQDGYEEEQRELSEQEKEFYRISRIVFAEAEKKYRSDWMNMNCRCYTNCLKD